MIQESNRIRYADGKEVEKPHTDIDLTRTSKWRIKDVNSRFAVNEEWYLGVDINREWKENGSRPIGGKLQEISFIQEPRQTGEVYSRDSAEARTRESIEYKLEDASEPPLTEKEQKQKDDLTRKDANEAENVRKEHQGELKEVVERRESIVEWTRDKEKMTGGPEVNSAKPFVPIESNYGSLLLAPVLFRRLYSKGFFRSGIILSANGIILYLSPSEAR